MTIPSMPLPDEPTSTLLVRRLPSSPRQLGVVLTDITAGLGDDAVGIVEFDLDHSQRQANLRRIEVIPERRGQGLGRRLMNGAAVLLRADGFEQMQCDNTEGLYASGFLLAVGFVAHPGDGRFLLYSL